MTDQPGPVREGTSFHREKLMRTRNGRTTHFRIHGESGDSAGFLTTGEYEDKRLGEIFVRISKHGGTLAGAFDSSAIIFSHALQGHVPLVDLCSAWLGLRFEPFGTTDDAQVPWCSSIVDYIARRLAFDYCTKEEIERLGLKRG